MGNGGLFPLGFAAIAGGLWFADSAYHGRPPLATLRDILQHPNQMADILGTANGTADFAQTIGPPTPASSPGGHPGTHIPKVPAGVLGGVVSFLEAQLGKPYSLGKAGPNAYDCSGLGYAAYKSVGVRIPRTTALMLVSPRGKFVAKKNIQPGDAIFPYLGHVFWAVGSGSNALCVEAPHTGEFVHYTKIYAFMTARRWVK